MDTTTCSPSWWPSPSSCSRPLFSTSARISSSNPHGKCSFPPCSSTLVVVEQHVALAQPRSRRCSPR
uniref:Uncharacterized protein n=1 Tax=Zea mays TaxID=4577 RepID=A0A804LNW6_MAIZE